MGSRSTAELRATVWRVAPLLFLSLLGAYLLIHPGFDSSEGGNHYAVAQQLLATGSLSFATCPPGVFYPSPSGRCYAAHELGNTIPMLLPALFGNALTAIAAGRLTADTSARIPAFLVSLLSSFYVAALATLLFLALVLIYRQSLGWSATAAVLFGTASLALTYSGNLFDGVLFGLLTFAGWTALVLGADRPSTKLVALAGVLHGAATATRITGVLTAFACLLFLVWKQWPRVKNGRPPGLALAVAYCAALLPFAAWQSWYNWARTGHALLSPVQTPTFAVNNALDGDMALALLGLLVSPGKSIFVYTPLLLAAPLGVAPMLRRRLDATLLATIIVLLHLAVVIRIRNWSGDWGWGPRYTVSILAFMFLPVALGLPYLWARRWGRATVAGLATLGLLIGLAGNLSNWHYRMSLAYQRWGEAAHSLLIWDPLRSQPADAVGALIANLSRPLTGRPWDVVEGASALNVATSNALSTWWATLLLAGAPRVVVLGTVAVLLCGTIAAAAGLVNLLRRGPPPGRVWL